MQCLHKLQVPVICYTCGHFDYSRCHCSLLALSPFFSNQSYKKKQMNACICAGDFDSVVTSDIRRLLVVCSTSIFPTMISNPLWQRHLRHERHGSVQNCHPLEQSSPSSLHWKMSLTAAAWRTRLWFMISLCLVYAHLLLYYSLLHCIWIL